MLSKPISLTNLPLHCSPGRERLPKKRAEQEKEDAERLAEIRENMKKEEAIEQAKALRTWTEITDDGERKFTAKYKSRAFDKVKLELEDGTIIAVPFDRLSEEDQEYVKGRAGIR